MRAYKLQMWNNLAGIWRFGLLLRVGHALVGANQLLTMPAYSDAQDSSTAFPSIIHSKVCTIASWASKAKF